jgi:hypothetical protein
MSKSLTDKQREQAERLRTLHNDMLVAKQRGGTMSEVAAAFDDGAMRGGRYAMGARLPPTEVPRQPATSPWSGGGAPPLNGPDPLGYSIEDQEPIGAPHEIEKAKAKAFVGPCADALARTDAVERTDDPQSVAPAASVSLRRRW